MATLQAAKSISGNSARGRFKQIPRERLPQPPPKPQLAGGEVFDALPASTGVPPAAETSHARPYHERLSEIEQRQLLLHTVTIYPGWELVSIQHRPENDLLIAYLVPTSENSDPTLAVREGRAMQIMMDATGDLRIKRPRRQRGNLVMRFVHWLVSTFGGAGFSIAA